MIGGSLFFTLFYTSKAFPDFKFQKLGPHSALLGLLKKLLFALDTEVISRYNCNASQLVTGRIHPEKLKACERDFDIRSECSSLLLLLLFLSCSAASPAQPSRNRQFVTIKTLPFKHPLSSVTYHDPGPR